MKTIIIIGGGASGLMAAIKASEHSADKAKIIIIEKNNKLGKKILVSGNGKCNFTNLKADKKYYNNPSFAENILNQFDIKETLQFFRDKGLFYEADSEGRVYPYSYNADTVFNILNKECIRNNIEITTGTTVKSIDKTNGQFIIKCSDKEITGDIVICSIGGRVGFNKAENNYNILNAFKLKMTDLSPALVPLITPKNQVANLSGIRIKASVSLMNKDKVIYNETGEVLFKEEGLSGIAIFNASLFYVRNKSDKNCFISLDLMPDYTGQNIIDRFNQSGLPLNDFLNGIFNKKISEKIIKDSKSSNISDIAKTIKSMKFDLVSTYNYEYAQITSGGICLNEINPLTLEVNSVPNLYLTGEVLDIDGECGGFNLQWAWSSGAVAGNNAGRKLFKL